MWQKVSASAFILKITTNKYFQILSNYDDDDAHKILETWINM